MERDILYYILFNNSDIYDKRYATKLLHFAYGYPDWTHKYHHAGFDISANRVMEILEEYMDENHDMQGDICFWVTGHSMGAGVANIVAAELLHGHSGINNRTDNVYCYTFASPNTFYLTDNTNTRKSIAFPDKLITENYREPHGVKYRCIFNVVNEDDFVPELPMKGCGWTKYGRTATLSFNSKKKRIEDIVKSESKYDITNTKKFINETYNGNTQTIRDIVDSFNEIFEDDPENMRYSAYTFDDSDYLISRDYLTEPIIPKNTKPYQKIDSNQLRQYQMPAYFMQYIAYCMHENDDNGNRVFEIPGIANLNQVGFAFAALVKRYNSQRELIRDRSDLIQCPHYLEPYYLLTKTICINDFK